MVVEDQKGVWYPCEGATSIEVSKPEQSLSIYRTRNEHYIADGRPGERKRTVVHRSSQLRVDCQGVVGIFSESQGPGKGTGKSGYLIPNKTTEIGALGIIYVAH